MKTRHCFHAIPAATRSGSPRGTRKSRSWHRLFLTAALAVVPTGSIAAGDKEDPGKGLPLVWSVEGSWSGVATDAATELIYAAGRDGKCVELDLRGKVKREIGIPQKDGVDLRLARFSRGGEVVLLTYSKWSSELKASDLAGRELWSRQRGVNDVWICDLDNDGADEVIAGYNGGIGLHVLNGKGELLWKSTDVANIWHVCAGPMAAGGQPQVICTAADGKVHIFGSDGKGAKEFDTGGYVSLVRLAALEPKVDTAMMVVAGSAPQGAQKEETVRLSGLAGAGPAKWSLDLPVSGKGDGIGSAVLASGRGWLAVAMNSGTVHVIGIEKGEIIASVSGQGSYPKVAWTSGKTATVPGLLVATGGKLNAFRVTSPK